MTTLFVILGRSKERSDAAQTLGSMPLPSYSNAGAERTPRYDPPAPVVNFTAWILGSSPRMTKWVEAWTNPLPNPLISFNLTKNPTPFHPHPFHRPHNPHTALAGTWCAPGIREGGGAGSAVLTVARLGDEP